MNRPASPAIVIAIDGPAASGKGTISRRLAKHFHFAHMDTGALYRLTALAVLEAGGDPTLEADALTGAATILARAATASWLNATVEIAFPYRRFQPGVGGVGSISSLVTAALSSGDRATILALATTLDNANNLGCPLS